MQFHPDRADFDELFTANGARASCAILELVEDGDEITLEDLEALTRRYDGLFERLLSCYSKHINQRRKP